MGTLSGKRALVTGGSRGIGAAIAEAFAEQGANVVIGCHAESPVLDKTLAAMRTFGCDALAIKANVADEDDAARLVRDALDHLGGIDIVVNNAGILHDKPLLETSVADFDQVIGVNLRGSFLVGRDAIAAMVAQGSGGRVINMSSDLAYLGRKNHTAYCASKGAIAAMTRAWAHEFAPAITVNSIAPGPIDTDMLGANVMSPEALAEDMDIPMQRFGKSEEVAAVAVLLASDAAGFITGQCYGVNGGSVMP